MPAEVPLLRLFTSTRQPCGSSPPERQHGYRSVRRHTCCCAFAKAQNSSITSVLTLQTRAACLQWAYTCNIPCSFTYALRRSSNCSPFAMSMILYCKTTALRLLQDNMPAANFECSAGFHSPAATCALSAALLLSRSQQPN